MERFPDNSRVCFVGDSITYTNTYLSYIVANYREKFPEAKVEFYNCGIAGATLYTTLDVFDEDITSYEPTHIVLMIGINDSNRSSLEKNLPDRYDRMATAFENYKKNLDVFCGRVKDIGAKLILCTPMPYDEYQDSETPTLRGCASAMLGYADYIKVFAKENGYPLCDYHSYITRELTLSDSPVYIPDRVHPAPFGHYLMAKCFLEFQGIKISQEQELPDFLKSWHEAVCKIRDAFSAEYMIPECSFSQNNEERMSAVLKFIESPSLEGDFFLQLANDYLENKKNQVANIEFVKNFMKNV